MHIVESSLCTIKIQTYIQQNYERFKYVSKVDSVESNRYQNFHANHTCTKTLFVINEHYEHYSRKIPIGDQLMIKRTNSIDTRIQCHRHMPLLKAGSSPGSVTNNSNRLVRATLQAHPTVSHDVLRHYPSTFPP